MGFSIKQSQTARPLTFLMIDSSDHISPKTGLSPTVTLSKNGGAFGSPSGAVSEVGSGWYKVAGNGTDSDTLGPLGLHATATGADPQDEEFLVVAYDPFGSPFGDVNMSQISGDATAADNLETMLDGTGGQTLKLGALAVSGATTLTGNVAMAAGLTITQSVANTPGLSVTGNGTGSGASFQGGGGTTSHGVIIASNATSTGHGIYTVGGGNGGHGLFAQGSLTSGAVGDGIRAAGNGTGKDIRLASSGTIFGDLSGSVGSVVGNVGGNVVGSVASVTAMVTANVIQVSGDGTAADNLEAAFDGTGYPALQVTLADNVAHGGPPDSSTATIAAKSVTVTNPDGVAMYLRGMGASGRGLVALGVIQGVNIQSESSGATDAGPALNIVGGNGSHAAVQITGASQWGMSIDAASSATGAIELLTTGTGVSLPACTTGLEVVPTNYGVNIHGDGFGVSLSSNTQPGLSIYSAANHGVFIEGGEAGAGVLIDGSATGASLKIIGPYTSGPIVELVNYGEGDGISITSAGAGKHDIALLGSGDIQGNLAGLVNGVAGTAQTLDALQTALNATHGAGSWATTVLPDVDGLSYNDFMEAMLAVMFGQATVSGSTVEFKKRDGTTTKVTVTMGATAGERTGSTIS